MLKSVVPMSTVTIQKPAVVFEYQMFLTKKVHFCPVLDVTVFCLSWAAAKFSPDVARLR